MNNYNKCYILTAFISVPLRSICKIEKDSYVVCADGGYAHALEADILPNLLIGDFDSYEPPLPNDINVVTLPKAKDETDLAACLKYVLDMDFTEITIIGGLGGRIDHTLGNLQNLVRFIDNRKKISIIDEKNFVTVLKNGSMTISRIPGYKLSLISHSEKCIGVSIYGVDYPLCDYTLTNCYPLGVSNEFAADEACVSVKEGTLFIILSKD